MDASVGTVAFPSCLSVKLLNLVYEIWTGSCQLWLFSLLPSLWLSVKVSLLPSNTLSGTIWSWMMNIVYMTTGKSVPPDPFCSSEHWHRGETTQTTKLVRAITSNMFENMLCTFRIICMCTLKAFLLWWWLSLNSIQHVVNEPEMQSWMRQVTYGSYLESLPLHSCQFMRCRPHPPVHCWLQMVILLWMLVT